MGLATTRRQARQIVTHGHIAVNGKRVDIPSALIKVGDEISVIENSRGKAYFKGMNEKLGAVTAPAWIVVNAEALSAKIDRFPTREEIDVPVVEQSIVELYSK
jgi:small subunit ribosomal protein S4